MAEGIIKDVEDKITFKEKDQYHSWKQFWDLLKKREKQTNETWSLNGRMRHVRRANKLNKTQRREDLQYLTVKIRCKHAGHFVSRSITRTRKTKSGKTGCEAYIQLDYQPEIDKLVISNLNLNHTGHLLGPPSGKNRKERTKLAKMKRELENREKITHNKAKNRQVPSDMSDTKNIPKLPSDGVSSSFVVPGAGENVSENQFLSILSQSLQALCKKYLDFNSELEIEGYMSMSFDKQKKVSFVLNEKVQKGTIENIVADNSKHSKSSAVTFAPSFMDIQKEENQHNEDVIHVYINDTETTHTPGVQNYEVVCTPFSKSVKQEPTIMGPDILPKEVVLPHIGKCNIQVSVDGSEQCNICECCGQTFETCTQRSDCRYCGKVFKTNKGLMAHISVHTVPVDGSDQCNTCECCGQTFETCTQRLDCRYCGKIFQNNNGLKAHIRVHTGGKPFKCDVCGVRYTAAACLKIHKRKHTGNRPYKCDVCDKCFASPTGIKAHKLWRHSSERPYTCDLCGRSCKSLAALKEHSIMHSTEKPYKCDVCEKTFKRRSCMIKHSITHTLGKPYQCHICGASYKRRDQLTTHSRKFHNK